MQVKKILLGPQLLRRFRTTPFGGPIPRWRYQIARQSGAHSTASETVSVRELERLS